jgi:hypothetical protein
MNKLRIVVPGSMKPANRQALDAVTYAALNLCVGEQREGSRAESGRKLAATLGPFLRDDCDWNPGLCNGEQTFADTSPQRWKPPDGIEKSRLRRLEHVGRPNVRGCNSRNRLFHSGSPEHQRQPLRQQRGRISQVIRMRRCNSLISERLYVAEIVGLRLGGRKCFMKRKRCTNQSADRCQLSASRDGWRPYAFLRSSLYCSILLRGKRPGCVEFLRMAAYLYFKATA